MKSCDYLCKIEYYNSLDINERSSIEFMTDVCSSVNDDQK